MAGVPLGTAIVCDGKRWDKLEDEVKKYVPLLAPEALLYFICQDKDEKLDGHADILLSRVVLGVTFGVESDNVVYKRESG
ncbi:hypothetical protein IGI04_014972 [Brassica rapa subsp. trilocularis]|uniref:Uncharacterized protein n=1 Tax=Brassica rapa subsp. trilocularis TaxID=1813537 RepID=A0ABQ7MNS6_BRACM|nr:hypothetical protein IGI04_014972 [Brassica rapa subsp. trilocularis]